MNPLYRQLMQDAKDWEEKEKRNPKPSGRIQELKVNTDLLLKHGVISLKKPPIKHK